MFANILTVVALSASALAHRSCGTPQPSESHREMSQKMAVAEKDVNITAAEAIGAIDVYFHVVASGNTEETGYIPQGKMNDQLSYMNKAYAPYGISFNLKAIDYTVNADWAKDTAEIDMKTALRKGDYRTLNLYFLSNLGTNLGYCYFPDVVQQGTKAFYRDGCTILSATVPGGSETSYNMGGTAVHETGHWLGLYHTFQGNSCSGTGDQIDDTPQQASATSGCPENRDSCPSKAGNDPIHNYMDYSDDACYEEFTPDQKARMESMWAQYRVSA
ncbi:Metalloproteases [Xylariomycetidae sp. FL0641]|nr:Metalloproteases [Xylariomycetidae sp. FL0641]